MLHPGAVSRVPVQRPLPTRSEAVGGCAPGWSCWCHHRVVLGIGVFLVALSLFLCSRTPDLEVGFPSSGLCDLVLLVYLLSTLWLSSTALYPLQWTTVDTVANRVCCIHSRQNRVGTKWKLGSPHISMWTCRSSDKTERNRKPHVSTYFHILLAVHPQRHTRTKYQEETRITRRDESHSVYSKTQRGKEKRSSHHPRWASGMTRMAANPRSLGCHMPGWVQARVLLHSPHSLCYLTPRRYHQRSWPRRSLGHPPQYASHSATPPVDTKSPTRSHVGAASTNACACCTAHARQKNKSKGGHKRRTSPPHARQSLHRCTGGCKRVTAAGAEGGSCCIASASWHPHP